MPDTSRKRRVMAALTGCSPNFVGNAARRKNLRRILRILEAADAVGRAQTTCAKLALSRQMAFAICAKPVLSRRNVFGNLRETTTFASGDICRLRETVPFAQRHTWRPRETNTFARNTPGNLRETGTFAQKPCRFDETRRSEIPFPADEETPLAVGLRPRDPETHQKPADRSIAGFWCKKTHPLFFYTKNFFSGQEAL